MLFHSLIAMRELQVRCSLFRVHLDGMKVVFSGEAKALESEIAAGETQKTLLKIRVNCKAFGHLLHCLLVLVEVHERDRQPVVEVFLCIGVFEMPDDMPCHRDQSFVLAHLKQFLCCCVLLLEQVLVDADGVMVRLCGDCE